MKSKILGNFFLPLIASLTATVINRNFASLLGMVCIVVLLSGCGGDGGSDDGEDGNNGGWINIESDQNPAISSKTLSGEAFKSYEYHFCINLYSQCNPGVTVSWSNRTLGIEGLATSHYEGITGFRHLWEAEVPLTPGANDIVLTASDPGGRYGTARILIKGLIRAPQRLKADPGDNEVFLDWNPVPGATGYRLYWSNSPDSIFPWGNTINVSSPPYRHQGLVNGQFYYYMVTALGSTVESAPSNETMELVGVPSKPANLIASLAGNDILLSWDDGDRADFHTLYWANEPGVDPAIANSIVGVTSPYYHTSLNGQPYYYRVVATNGFGDSDRSAEVNAYPDLPPPTPSDLNVTLRPDPTGGYLPIIDLAWNAPGAETEIYKCRSTATLYAPSMQSCNDYLRTHFSCSLGYTRIDKISDQVYQDNDISQPLNGSYYAYGYYLVASNTYGQSLPSASVRICSGLN